MMLQRDVARKVVAVSNPTRVGVGVLRTRAGVYWSDQSELDATPTPTVRRIKLARQREIGPALPALSASTSPKRLQTKSAGWGVGVYGSA